MIEHGVGVGHRSNAALSRCTLDLLSVLPQDQAVTPIQEAERADAVTVVPADTVPPGLTDGPRTARGSPTRRHAARPTHPLDGALTPTPGTSPQEGDLRGLRIRDPTGVTGCPRVIRSHQTDR